MNGGEYATVAERITLFYARYPRGRIVTRLLARTEQEITVQAFVTGRSRRSSPPPPGWPPSGSAMATSTRLPVSRTSRHRHRSSACQPRPHCVPAPAKPRGDGEGESRAAVAGLGEDPSAGYVVGGEGSTPNDAPRRGGRSLATTSRGPRRGRARGPIASGAGRALPRAADGGAPRAERPGGHRASWLSVSRACCAPGPSRVT